jgi:2'-hydroxyisoflavone reductase
MPIDRREFMLRAGLLGIAATAGALPSRASSRQRLLILGGTGFIGPHLVEQALARGHDVTLFNRGRTNTHLFPEAKRLVGDRDGGLDALKDGSWDVVIDNSGYVPRHVRDSAQLLEGRVGRYLFTSTVAVYDFVQPAFPYTVGSPLAPLSEPGSEDVGRFYGPLKVLCEQAVNDVYGERATIVRPTYVCGPGDRTQRYTWWVDRVYRGGDILAPGDPLSGLGLIDVRDLAKFTIHLAEQGTPGTYNASGPAGVLSFAGMLDSIRATTGTPVRFHWVGADFLRERSESRELPLWNARAEGYHGLLFENQRSIDAGLTFTTLAKMARDTRAWHQSLPNEQQIFTRAGMAPEKEQAILAEWRKRS